MDENYAYLTCQCGAKFQVLKTVTQSNDDGEAIDVTDWDEEATAKAFNEHVCS